MEEQSKEERLATGRAVLAKYQDPSVEQLSDEEPKQHHKAHHMHVAVIGIGFGGFAQAFHMSDLFDALGRIHDIAEDDPTVAIRITALDDPQDTKIIVLPDNSPDNLRVIQQARDILGDMYNIEELNQADLDATGYKEPVKVHDFGYRPSPRDFVLEAPQVMQDNYKPLLQASGPIPPKPKNQSRVRGYSTKPKFHTKTIQRRFR